MHNYSFEFLTIAILFTISLFYRKRWRRSTFATKLFISCIAINALASVSDIAASVTLNNAASLPRWVNILTNQIYWMLMFSMIYAYAVCILYRISLYSDNKERIKHIAGVFTLIFVITLGISLAALPSGLIFYIDDNLAYRTGPLWCIGYVLLTLAIICCCTASLISGTVSKYSISNTLKFLIPTVYLLVGVKITFPDVLIETTIGAVTCLFIYMNYLSSAADVDPLTKFRKTDSLAEEIRLWQEDGRPFQLILIAFRDFDSVNSTLGYESGNEMILRVSVWLSDFYANYDLFRHTSLSFAVLLPISEKTDTEKRIDDLLNAFPEEWSCGETNIRITPYVADLVCRNSDLSYSQIFDELDFAKKQVKASKFEHMHFDDSLNMKLERRQYLISYLQRAIQNKLFDVYYQPIFSPADNAFTTAEALVRLKDITGTYIPPEQFMPLAEQSGQAEEISKMVVEKVCAFLRDNSDLGLEYVSINLIIQQLRDVSFADYLNQSLASNGLSRSQVALEITERMLLSGSDIVQETLNKLRDSGYSLLLDDFGTGYSNFASLLKGRIDKIKLDKSLLSSGDGRDMTVVDTLIGLFHTNGQGVVVEGVETVGQRDFLIEHGADHLQGYLYSRPLPQGDFRKFIIDYNGLKADKVIYMNDAGVKTSRSF